MRQSQISGIYIILFLLVFISCSDEQEITEPGRPSEQQVAIDYFREIALGFEFGNASQVTRKWVSNIRVFVEGSSDPILRNELEGIINDLNILIIGSGINISITENRSESNFFVFLGTGAEYAEENPQASGLVESNLGLFFVSFNGQDQIFDANMYVDTERASPLKQRHLLREEFTQALGLARDSSRFPNSIFQSSFEVGCATEFSDLDEIIIRILYDRRVATGLNEEEVVILLEDIISDFL